MKKVFVFLQGLTYLGIFLSGISFFLFVFIFFVGDTKEYIAIFKFFTGSLFLSIHFGTVLLITKACYIYIKKNENYVKEDIAKQ